MAATANLKVVTLNCWGVFTPVACEKRHERMTAIAEELSKGEYDVILLQEIWTQSDYEKICAKVCNVLQYTHYFHSGMFGSGLCMFSKYPILETFQRNYSLNGYAHKIVHGDWFCGKAVGLAKIVVNDLRINIYVTHTHAEYQEESNEYRAHRVSQAYEMSQFIKMTSESCDALIIGGDFNFKPSELGYKMVIANACLSDSWLTQKDKPGHQGTSDRHDNSFSSLGDKYPDGKTLDYLLYRANTGCEMSCEKCYVTMQKVPGQDYNYSDHEGVGGVFTIKSNLTAMGPQRDCGEVEKLFTEALPILDSGTKKVRADQVFYSVSMLMAIVALVFTADFSLPFGLDIILVLARFILTVGVFFCGWSVIVMANRELNGITATRKDINNLLRGNPPM